MSEEMKRGRFALSGEMIRSSEFKFLRKIMENVVVFHTEARFDRDQITYFAYHPDFEEISLGMTYTEYMPVISHIGQNIYVEWRKL